MSASILIVSADSLIVLEVGPVGLIGRVGPVGDSLGGLDVGPVGLIGRVRPVGDTLGGLGIGPVGRVGLVGEVGPVRAPNQWQPSTPPHGGGGGGFLPLSRLFIIFAA